MVIKPQTTLRKQPVSKNYFILNVMAVVKDVIILCL